MPEASPWAGCSLEPVSRTHPEAASGGGGTCSCLSLQDSAFQVQKAVCCCSCFEPPQPPVPETCGSRLPYSPSSLRDCNFQPQGLLLPMVTCKKFLSVGCPEPTQGCILPAASFFIDILLRLSERSLFPLNCCFQVAITSSWCSLRCLPTPSLEGGQEKH